MLFHFPCLNKKNQGNQFKCSLFKLYFFSVEGPLIVLVVVMRNIVMPIQLVLAVTCVDEESIAKKEPISKEASITRKKKRKHGMTN